VATFGARQFLSISWHCAARRYDAAYSGGEKWTLAACGPKISVDYTWVVREDKEKNMSSLFARKRHLNPEMLTLPAFCVPAEESAKLDSKREAQLEWMRARGVPYILGSQVQRHTPAPEKRVA
jgi:hypothetical protein